MYPWLPDIRNIGNSFTVLEAKFNKKNKLQIWLLKLYLLSLTSSAIREITADRKDSTSTSLSFKKMLLINAKETIGSFKSFIKLSKAAILWPLIVCIYPQACHSTKKNHHWVFSRLPNKYNQILQIDIQAYV